MRDLVYPLSKPADQVVVTGPVDRISYAEAQDLTGFRPVVLGEQFGPLWATYWFRIETDVPTEWAGKQVHLLWETHSEATLWVNGRSIQGLNHNPGSWDGSTRPDAVILNQAKGGEHLAFQIEMACNKLFGDEGNYGQYAHLSPYVFDRCDIAVFDPEAWELYHDFSFLQQLEADGKPGGDHELDYAWSGLLLSELNRFANVYDLNDRSTWKPAQEILKALYQNRNATFTHEQWAIGHAHIDTAWLWPLAETWRKCDRTFSSQTTYMETYPDYHFSCSQAAQYEVVQQRNPDLYARIKARVATGQWVPVGGTWVEPDCNIPSGEALIRQFLYGQRFFKKEFGKQCNEFWNPDVFGYNGQLPQIMNICGIKRFLTQKLSWNQFNKPEHHTFMWEGIDGSQVLTHFPPMDTYNAIVTPEQLRFNIRNYKDNDRSNVSLILFGYGDGGGGPTKTMLERLKRAEDIPGIPRTRMGNVDDFFARLEESFQDRTKLVGELYFEYHRGTYTTQAAVKKGNRKSEFALHDAEFLSTWAARGGHAYPQEKIDELWKLVLLNQFHDILPGSSITLVYEDASRHHNQVVSEGTELGETAISALGNSGNLSPINTIGFERSEVVTLPSGELSYVTAPSYGVGTITEAPDKVSIAEESGNFLLENKHLQVTLLANGTVHSIVEKVTGREALTAPGNQFALYEDRPLAHDAWDIDPFHLETEKLVGAAISAKIVETSPLRVGVEFEYKIGKGSTLRQVVSLSADSRYLDFDTDVDWHEDHLLLKVLFPVNVRAMNATYEMQFGIAERPTHFNTSFDLARFEVPAHKFVDLSEHGFGVSILSESKYGFSTFDNVMRISLLRSPKHPDPVADRGLHKFSYAILPHEGGWREAGIVAEGFRYNVPVRFGKGLGDAKSLYSVDTPNLVLDTVKKAEDSDNLVLRFYECHGSRGVAKVKIGHSVTKATYVNGLEEELGEAQVIDGVLSVPYAPYKVISVKIQ